MSSYETFARFYDYLTENVDYKVRSDYISNFFSDCDKSGKLLDLACGTGTFSKLFSDKGYSVTGMDISEEMLTAAQNKCSGKVDFLKGDITDFLLPEKYDFCICMLDSINHLEGIEDVRKSFNCVYNALNDGGIFVFDVNTVYKHKFVLADNTFVFDEEDFFLAWDNEYTEDNRVRIILDFFVYNGKSYDRYSEEFYEKAYEIEELMSALSQFEIIGVYDELTENLPKEDSERVYFVCKRKKLLHG